MLLWSIATDDIMRALGMDQDLPPAADTEELLLSESSVDCIDCLDCLDCLDSIVQQWAGTHVVSDEDMTLMLRVRDSLLTRRMLEFRRHSDRASPGGVALSSADLRLLDSCQSVKELLRMLRVRITESRRL